MCVHVKYAGFEILKNNKNTDNAMVFNAEFMVILEALRWLEIKPFQMIVMSDSFSVLQALQSYSYTMCIVQEIK